MKKSVLAHCAFATGLIAASIFLLVSCSANPSATTSGNATIDSLKNQISQLTAGNEAIAKKLVKFDTLDFTVFSNQQWTRLHESHAATIKVYWPDGHVATGLEKHIEDLKALFVYAPGTRIKEHPIHFGSADFTAVTGVFEGTFTKPMPIGNGKFIQPTGKAFKMPMCTIGIWKDGIMIEEHLFWDNKTYIDQIGLGK